MIVIATYNNPKLLTDLLDSMVETVNMDEKILVVCTDPKQTEMIEFLKELPSKYSFDISTDVTSYAGYDTGAYIYAYKKYKEEDYYIFLQDSITIKSPEWLNAFKNYRKLNVLTAWVLFPMCWDFMEQTQWVESKFKQIIFKPTAGIFGPMFQVARNTLKKIDKEYNLDNFIPSRKVIEQQGMERCWSYLAAHCGIEVNSIDGYFLDWDNKQYIKKHFQKRD
jgi:hypothetical protein